MTGRKKAAYRVPSMRQIGRIKPNGFHVASLFAGGGGSSLGYRLAGYKILYANEVVPEAAACYRANAAPGTVVDESNVRDLTGDVILDAVEAATGVRELSLLDGSPPCMSFSTAGKRQGSWGKTGQHTDGTFQVSDDLLLEHARLVGEVRPQTFIAENVTGLAKGVAVGYLQRWLAALRGHGYVVGARVLDFQWLGVPQARKRLIVIGVRDDLGLQPVYPEPLRYRYSVRDACPWLLRQGDNGGFGKGSMRATDLPSPTFGASPQTGNGKFPPSQVVAVGDGIRMQRGPKAPVSIASLDEPAPTLAAAGLSNVREYQATLPDGTVRRQLTLAELRRLSSFPDDFVLTGTRLEGWARLGNAVPPVGMSHIAAAVRDGVLLPSLGQSNVGQT